MSLLAGVVSSCVFSFVLEGSPRRRLVLVLVLALVLVLVLILILVLVLVLATWHRRPRRGRFRSMNDAMAQASHYVSIYM